MSKLLLIVAIALTGCASKKPEYINVPYTVEKIVYCAADVGAIEYEAEKIKKEFPIEQKIKMLLIDRQQRIIAESQLRAELKACQKP